MIFLIIASEQAGGRISKDTSTLAAIVVMVILVNIKIFISGRNILITTGRAYLYAMMMMTG